MIVEVRTKYLISSSIQKKLHDKRLAYFGLTFVAFFKENFLFCALNATTVQQTQLEVSLFFVQKLT
jgi:hypothetical protein